MIVCGEVRENPFTHVGHCRDLRYTVNILDGCAVSLVMRNQGRVESGIEHVRVFESPRQFDDVCWLLHRFMTRCKEPRGVRRNRDLLGRHLCR
jgi:hypothetical protein